MGLTPSAATAADLLRMLPTACLKTFKFTKNVLLLFLLCAAIHDFGAVAMDGGAATCYAPQASQAQPGLAPYTRIAHF